MRQIACRIRTACHARAASTSSSSVDHYEVLGLKPDASAKEIKAAYYNLSMKHHPDTNPGDKDAAAAKFHQVARSYEVLGSEEKRRAYDAGRQSASMRHSYHRATSRPSYTDLDLDYKNFEQFQKAARRRQFSKTTWEMPDEFYKNLSGARMRPRQFKSVFDEATERINLHKDSRQMKREMEELRRAIEKEQEEQQKKYPMPTFEQLLQRKRLKEAEEQRKYAVGLILAAMSGMILFMAIR